MGNREIKKILLDISEHWEAYVKHCMKFENGKKRYTVSKDHKLYETFKNELKNIFETLVEDTKVYKVAWSLGEGNLAGIPWLAVMDRSITNSTTEGFYVVYLFSRNAKKVFLSIGIGATQFHEVFGKNISCISMIEKAKEFFLQNFENYAPPELDFDQMDLFDAKDKNFERTKFSSPMKILSGSYEAGCFFYKTI